MKVSVVIPCYNASAHIARSLDAVLAQSYPVTEIICVDDGSSDDTLLKLNEYADRFPRKIKVLEQKNSGAGAARNTGLHLATGDYIQFLDADDSIRPEKIELQLQLAETSGVPGIIAGNFIRYSGRREERVAAYCNDVWIALIRGRLGSTCSNLFLRSALMQVNGWNDTLKSSQETELMFRLLCAGSSVAYDAAFNTDVFLRESGSISKQNPSGNLERFIRIRMDIFYWLQKQEQLTAERKKEIAAILLGTLRMLFTHDSELAVRLHKELFLPNFEAALSPQISRKYLYTYKLLGFRGAQRIFSRIRR